MLVPHHLPPTGHQQVMELQALERRFAHYYPTDLGLEQAKTKQTKSMKRKQIQHILKVLPWQKELLNSTVSKLKTVSIRDATQELHKLRRTGKLLLH